METIIIKKIIMKLAVTTFWIFILSFLYSNDNTVSQNSDPVIIPDTITYIIPASTEMNEIQLKAFNSRVKLLYCEILLTQNNQAIEELKSIRIRKYLHNYSIKEDSLVKEIKVINKNN